MRDVCDTPASSTMATDSSGRFRSGSSTPRSPHRLRFARSAACRRCVMVTATRFIPRRWSPRRPGSRDSWSLHRNMDRHPFQNQNRLFHQICLDHRRISAYHHPLPLISCPQVAEHPSFHPSFLPFSHLPLAYLPLLAAPPLAFHLPLAFLLSSPLSLALLLVSRLFLHRRRSTRRNRHLWNDQCSLHWLMNLSIMAGSNRRNC